MTSSPKFVLAVKVDENDLRAVNARLESLATTDARKAIRRGFRRWMTEAKRVAKSLAPAKSKGSTVRVRGETMPNTHLRTSIVSRTRGYSRGAVQWAAVGVKSGHNYPPDWYLYWVEYGHAIRRRRRGRALANVAPTYFLRRTAQIMTPKLPAIVSAAVDEVVNG